LNDMLRNGSKWKWTPEQQMAFEEMKAKFVTDPVLAGRTLAELSPYKQAPATTASEQY